MPAQGEQLIQYPFAGGLDQKTRAELVEPGSFLRLENVVQNKRGTYQKRAGNLALTLSVQDGTTIGAGVRLFPFGAEPVLVDGHKAFGYSSRLTAWKYHDRVPEAVVDRLPIAQLGLQAANYDVALTTNGFIGVLYSTVDAAGTLSVYAVVVDSANNQIMTPPLNFASYTAATTFRLVAVGTTLVALFLPSGSTNVDAYTFDASSLVSFSSGWLGHSSIITDAGTSAIFDAVGLTDRWVIAYVNNSGTASSITMKAFDTGPTLLQTTTELAGITPNGVALGGVQSDTVWLAYNYAGGNVINVCGRNPANIVVALAATQAVITMALGPANWLGIERHPTVAGAGIVAVVGGATDRNLYYRQFTTSITANVSPSGSTAKKYRLRLESRPFSDGTRFYAMARYDVAGDASQNMLFALDLSEDARTIRPVGTVAPRLSGPAFVGFAAHVAKLATNKVAIVHAAKKSAVSSALELVTLDFSGYTRWQPSAFADVECIAGGVPSYYDGTRVEELGFLVAPDKPIVSSVGGGSLNGTYSWVLVFEKFDRKGNVHRSAPSAPQQFAIGAGNKAQLVVNTLQVTSRQDLDDPTSPVRVAVYRTDAGGSIYYRCVGLETANDPTVDTLTIVDNTTQATLLASEQLYTQPAAQLQGQVTAQPKRAAPSFSCMIAHQDRLFGIADDGSIWFTGQRVQGEGPWFADLFQFPIGIGSTSKPVALASQDGRLIVFRSDPVIAYIEGDGPPDSGVGNDFTPPRYVATDVGCTNLRSVVTTPIGTFFQSPRGIELLNRSMQVEPFFGRPVEDTLNANPIITSAVLFDAQGRVVFSCLPSEGAASGVFIVYDFVNQVWTTQVKAAGAVSACMVNGVYYWLAASGHVYQETPAQFLDGGAWVTQTIETPNLHVAGVKGFQHASEFFLYAEKLTDADVKIEIAYDNKAYLPQDVYTFTAAEIAALDRPELSCRLRQPLCQSVRARITDATPTGGPAAGTGQGPIFISLAISVGLEKGAARRAPAASQ